MVLQYENLALDTTPVTLPEAVLIVPAHNEHEREEYPRALDSYAQAFSNAYTHQSEYGLFVVDNGSTTNETGTTETANIALEYGFNVLESPVKGKGAAIRYGVAAVMNSLGNPDPTKVHMAFADADGAYDVHTVFSLLERTHGNADIAVAQRLMTPETPKDELSRRVAHVIIQKYMNWRIPTGVSDPNAGAMAFSGGAITLWQESVLNGYTTPAEVLHKAYKKGLHAVEVKAVINNAEESRVNRRADGIQLIKDVSQVRRAA